jgi:hypothetical protein
MGQDNAISISCPSVNQAFQLDRNLEKNTFMVVRRGARGLL